MSSAAAGVWLVLLSAWFLIKLSRWDRDLLHQRCIRQAGQSNRRQQGGPGEGHGEHGRGTP